MAAAQPLNFAGRPHLAHIPYTIRRVEGKSFVDAYSQFATTPIPALSMAQQFPMLTYTSAHSNEAFEIYLVSERREVGNHILRCHCLNQRQYANGNTDILIDRVDLTFDDWLYNAHRYYQQHSIKDDWLVYISSHLIQILTRVVAGLKQLFDAGLYHGNLLEGIALKKERGEFVGYLFRMKNVSGETDALQRRDVTDLLTLFDRSVELGYLTSAAADEAKSAASKLKSPPPLLTYFQRFTLLVPEDASSHWIEDRPIFLDHY